MDINLSRKTKNRLLDFLVHHNNKSAMKAYIESLKELIAIGGQSKPNTQTEQQRVVVEPLETQIRRWWSNLPPALQDRSFHILEIAGVCSGRYKPRPALREIAAALRAMGWTEQRDWTKGGGNRRTWRAGGSSNR